MIVRRHLLFRTGKFRIAVIFGEGGDAERIALLHGLGVLRIREIVAVPLRVRSRRRWRAHIAFDARSGYASNPMPSAILPARVRP